MAKCKKKVILVVTCSTVEKEAVEDVTGESFPLEIEKSQWFRDFNDYSTVNIQLWGAASGVTYAIRKKIAGIAEAPETIVFR